MLHCPLVFHSLEHITLDGMICRNAFWTKFIWLPLHWLGKFNERRTITHWKPGTHILKNPIVVESLPVSYCYNIAHTQTTHFSRSCSNNRNFGVFIETYKNVITLLPFCLSGKGFYEFMSDLKICTINLIIGTIRTYPQGIWR